MTVPVDSRDHKVNAAVYYFPEAYTVSDSKRIMGRQAAGEGFLHALFRYSGHHEFHCYTETSEHFSHFRTQLGAIAPGKTANWIPCADPARLETAGNLFISAPGIAIHAWRRYRAGHSYGLTGLTHTVCSEVALRSISELVTAPVGPTDALICTSTSVRKMVEEIIRGWEGFLAERFGAIKPFIRPEFPVIPLGVDCDRYTPDKHRAERVDFRRKHNIPEDHVVVLYFGRLSVHAKAHPLPMLVALEQAARNTDQPVVLLLAGWAANDAILNAFIDAAKRLCPTVRVLVIDPHKQDIRAGVWAAADIFCSLVDNIQESFGLTPIEAQAAGLPVVVSDWDGYRDTVVHGKTGFRIPTLMPGPGNGEELIWRYMTGVDNYDQYVGKVSQCIAVDIPATVTAFTALLKDPALRRSMGEEGRRRALSLYDWQQVIPQYQALWQELAAGRDFNTGNVPDKPGPAILQSLYLPDPFSLFSGFPTRPLTGDNRVQAASGDPRRLLINYRKMEINMLGKDILVPELVCNSLVDTIISKGPLPVSTLLVDYPPAQHPAILRTMAWLVKFGLLTVSESNSYNNGQ